MLRSIVLSVIVVASCSLAGGSTLAGQRGPEFAASLGFRNGASLDTSSTGRPGAEAGGAPSWGVSIGWWVRPDAWFEVFFDRQTLEFEPVSGSTIERFDMKVDHLQFGGGYEPPREGVRPYVTVAVGLGRYGADPGSVDDATGLSGSIGAGFEVPMGPKAVFRLEARGWGTVTSGAAAVSCGPGCSLAVGGDGFWQIGLRAAVVFCPGGRP